MKRVVFLVYTFLLLSLPTFASAAISIPYVVDYKDQVTFGDAAEISYQAQTYLGLENYSQKYVGGFANLSYTYTHHACCYDNFYPLLYITQFDPISVPQIDGVIGHTYQFQQMNRGMGHETDLYFVEIQFDQSGYRITVKNSNGDEIENKYYSIPEITADSFVALANRHPRSDPPGPNSMSFEPVKIKELATEPEHLINPVIIIPGIMGSAKKNGELLIDPILHTYDDLIATLEANGYQKEKNLFTFPYEWRDSNVLTARLLKDKISAVQTLCETAKSNNEITTDLGQTDCTKVDLVAHSMGGLVAREYAQSTEYRRDIDQLIFLGTPHKGSQKAYLQWEAGEFPPGLRDFLAEQFFASEARRNGYKSIFEYIHLRPILSVQELLPITDYIKDKDTGVTRNYPNNYPVNVFLESLNANTDKLLNSGIKINNIIGNIGADTINSITVVPSSDDAKWVHGEPDSFEYWVGDRTNTIVGSSINDSFENEEVPITHGALPKMTSGKIYKLLTGKTVEEEIFLSPIEKILSIDLHSPIDILVISPDGKKMGKNFETGGEYNEIPGAFYSGFQTDEEYITIPNPIDGEYKIELQGTGSGKYEVLTSYISDEVSTTTEVLGVTTLNQKTSLEVVVDNNNPESLNSEKVVTLDILISDIKLAYDIGWIKDKKVRDNLIKQVNNAIKFNKKIDIIKERLPNGSIKEKRVERFETKVNKILVKLFMAELQLLLKKKAITKEAFDLIKYDVDYLTR